MNNLMIVDYTQLSYAVFGPTQPWAKELRELGGKYNSNLKSGPGWIFSKSNGNIARLQSFVQQANYGKIKPYVSYSSNFDAPIYSKDNFNYNSTHTLPTPNYNSTHTLPTPRYHPTLPIVQIPNLENLSNLEIVNNEEYQTITYKLPKPRINQKVIINDSENYREYFVSEVESNGLFIHSFYLKHKDGTEGSIKVIIKAGKWVKDSGEITKQTFFFY